MSYDHRDVAGHLPRWMRIDEERGTITFDIEDDEGFRAVTVRLEWEVCGTCGGAGKHVNPSIDSHGLTREDFDEDPDFREDYFSGRYDVTCNECGGRRVVPTSEDPLFVERRREEWSYAREIAHERAMGY